MKSVSSEHLQGIREEIDLFDNIRDEIAKLTDVLQDMNTLTPDMHRDSDFKVMFDAVMAKLKSNHAYQPHFPHPKTMKWNAAIAACTQKVS